MYDWLLEIKTLLSEAEKQHQVTDLVETMGLGRAGVTIERIEEVERLLKCAFPPSLKQLYLHFNGIGDHEESTELMSLEELVIFNQEWVPFEPFDHAIILDRDHPDDFYHGKPKHWLAFFPAEYGATVYCLDTKKKPEMPIMHYDPEFDHDKLSPDYPSIKACLLQKMNEKADEIYDCFDGSEVGEALSEQVITMTEKECLRHGGRLEEMWDSDWEKWEH